MVTVFDKEKIRKALIQEVYHHKKILGYRVTVCELINGNGEAVAVGVSFCSPLDTYKRKWGNMIARGRAFKALSRGRCSNPVRPKLRPIAPFPFKCVCVDGHEEHNFKDIKIIL
jgi:hypothetical protein